MREPTQTLLHRKVVFPAGGAYSVLLTHSFI